MTNLWIVQQTGHITYFSNGWIFFV